MSDNGQNMRIYSIIEQIEDAIENSPRPKIGSSAGKRIVEIDEIHDLLGDLKVTIPEDIRRANSVMLQAETMINNAAEHAREVVEDAQKDADTLVAASNEKSEQILANARKEYERLVSEDEIYQEAQRRAKLLAKKAEYSAGVLFDNAKVYADEVMADLERFLGEYQQQIVGNRRELDARAQHELHIETTELPLSAAAYAQPVPSGVVQPNTVQPSAQAAPMQAAPAVPMQAAPQNAVAQNAVRPVTASVQQPMVQPGMQQPMARPMAQPMQPPVAQPPQSGTKPARGRKKPDDDFLDDYDDDDDFEDSGEKKGLFGGLFKRKSKPVDDDFDDDFE